MGLNVAKILAQKGANIMIVARNVEKLESALQEIKVIRHLHNRFKQ
jgi:short-subunit dehydrogenase